MTKLYDGFGTHQTRLIEDQVMTDLMIAAPAFDLATAAAKAGLPTYLYRYDYLRPLQVGQVPGPIHFDEVYAVFDTMRAVANKTGPAPQPETPDTRRIVASVERHWTRFATSGDPAIDRDWPRFDAASGEMLGLHRGWQHQNRGGPDRALRLHRRAAANADTQDRRVGMNHTLDVRGLKCPLPVLKARRALREVAVGDLLIVLATDPQAPEDFVHFCKTTGAELVSSEAGPEEIRITLRRAA